MGETHSRLLLLSLSLGQPLFTRVLRVWLAPPVAVLLSTACIPVLSPGRKYVSIYFHYLKGDIVCCPSPPIYSFASILEVGDKELYHMFPAEAGLSLAFTTRDVFSSLLSIVW